MHGHRSCMALYLKWFLSTILHNFCCLLYHQWHSSGSLQKRVSCYACFNFSCFRSHSLSHWHYKWQYLPLYALLPARSSTFVRFMNVFICSKWPVKTNKPISIHTHMCSDATLVLISLRFVLIISTSCTRAHSHPFANWQYRWLWSLWSLNEGKLLEDMVVLEQLSHVTTFCACCPHFLVTQCS